MNVSQSDYERAVRISAATIRKRLRSMMRHVDIDDLIQDAMVVAWKNVVEKGGNLSRYAYWSTRAAIHWHVCKINGKGRRSELGYSQLWSKADGGVMSMDEFEGLLTEEPPDHRFLFEGVPEEVLRVAAGRCVECGEKLEDKRNVVIVCGHFKIKGTCAYKRRIRKTVEGQKRKAMQWKVR